MRVLVVAPDYGGAAFGGIGVHINGLVRGLLALGNHVDVLAPEYARSDTGNEESPNLRVFYWSAFGPPGMDDDPDLYRYGSPSLRDLQNCIGIVQAAPAKESMRYDVVHAHDFRTLNAGVALAEMFACALITTKHTTPGRHWPALTAEYAKRVEVWGFLHSDAVITVSERVASEAIELCGPRVASRTTVVYNGTEFGEMTSTFAPPLDHTNLTEILFVGRLQDSKGPDVAIEVFGKLPPRFRLTVVGDGPLRDQLESRVVELGVADRVSFVGKVPRARMAMMYRSAHLLLLTSRAEAGSIVVRESQALGVPVVGSSVGGMPELLENGKAGVLVSPPSVDGFVSAIMNLSADYPRWTQLRDDASVVVRAFSWANVAARTVEVYERAMAARRLR